MPLVIPPGFGSAAVIFVGPHGTAPYVTTIGVDLSAAGGDYVAAADNVFLSARYNFVPLVNNELTLSHVTLAVGQDGPGGSVQSSLPSVPCEATSPMAPTAMSVIAAKTTNNIGRRGRGRMFIPGSVPESAVDEGGNLSDTFIPQVNVVLSGFLAGLELGQPETPPYPATPPTPGVLLHSAGLEAPAPTPIVSLTCRPVVGWVRGRIR